MKDDERRDKIEYSALLQELDERFSSVEKDARSRPSEEELGAEGAGGSKLLSFYEDVLQCKTRRQCDSLFQKNAAGFERHLASQKHAFVDEDSEPFWSEISSLLSGASRAKTAAVYPVLLGLLVLCVDKGNSLLRRRELWTLVCRTVSQAESCERVPVQEAVELVSRHIRGFREKSSCFRGFFEDKKVRRSNAGRVFQKKKLQELRKENKAETRLALEKKKEEDSKYKKKMNRLEGMLQGSRCLE